MRLFIILSRDGIHYIGSEEEVEVAFLCDGIEDAEPDRIVSIEFEGDAPGRYHCEAVVRKSDAVEPARVASVFRQLEQANVI